MYKLTINIKHAALHVEWITERGGVALWHSLDLGRPDTIWSTPANANGRPHWSADTAPYALITDPAEIAVVQYTEFKRIHVALRVSGNGLSVKLTDASNGRLNKYLAKAGEGATYEFDYGSQEAVILVPKETVSLAAWMAASYVEYQATKGKDNGSH